MNVEDAKRIWPEEWLFDIEIIDDAIRELNISKDSLILDVGTGQGIMAISLALYGYDVLSGEPEEGSKEHAKYERQLEEFGWSQKHEGHGYLNWREAAQKAGVQDKIRYQHFNAEQLYFPKESFDAVFLYDALQHIQNREKALQECIRVTKPMGIICVIEANAYSQQHYLEIERHEIDLVDPRELLNDNGITVKVIKGQCSDVYVLRKA